MRNVLLIVLALMASLTLWGCSADSPNKKTNDNLTMPKGDAAPVKQCKVPEEEYTAPGIEGYVVDQRDGRFLVVDNVPKDYGAGGEREFYDAIWFSYKQEDVKIGQKVQVWFSLVKESYPGQSAAEKVHIVPASKPKQAILNEAEAIREALVSLEVDHNGVPVIKTVNYDETTDIWNISIKQADEVIQIQIEDKFTRDVAEARVLDAIPSCGNELQSFNDITSSDQSPEGYKITATRNCEPLNGEGPQMETIYEYLVSADKITKLNK